MAALVQALPQQASTVTMLQSRPSSASGTFTAPSQAPSQQNLRGQQTSRNTYNAAGGSGNSRGHQAMPTVAPYAFTSTPGLANPDSRQTPRPESPSALQSSQKPSANGVSSQRLHPPAAGSVPSSSSNSSLRSHVSKDDTAIPTGQRAGEPRPLSTVNLPSSSPFLNISSPTISSKPSPDRYRRGNRRPENAAGAQASLPRVVHHPSGSSTGVSSHDPSSQANNSTSLNTQGPFQGPARHVRVSSADDTSVEKPQHPELAKRYRRRSLASMDTTGLADLRNQMHSQETMLVPISDPKPREERLRPRSSHSHSDSSDSVSSTRSSNRSAVSDPGTVQSVPPPKEENMPSSTLRMPEIPKRQTSPSPLSNQVTMSPVSPAPDSPVSHESEREATPSATPNEGSATKRLAEITRSEQKKSGKSRLRRAFSFGSAADLRRATAQNVGKKEATEPEKSRRQQLTEELGEEQAAIAEQQEASGLGESIYANTGHFFSGSTDNLSVSSTASSASVMLRKMSKGMKKSTRSLVGLFRSKSLKHSTDPAVKQPMPPQVSVVNIEAEREGVSVNSDPRDQRGGGTIFPKLGGTTGNTSKPSSVRSGSSADNARARKSIVGGEKERAEALTSVTPVRKGILKRPTTDSGNSSPSTNQNGELGLPHIHASDSPHSSAPSTPDDQSRSRRTDSVKIEGEDYFVPGGRLAGQETKAPVVKNIVFSPRIQFHETWPSGEYDRRGDIATCNRLTPLLAQQIKEELNSFKMEMEVHETSKVYTHFL